MPANSSFSGCELKQCKVNGTQIDTVLRRVQES
jgi:hypothetical protein